MYHCFQIRLNYHPLLSLPCTEEEEDDEEDGASADAEY
jgi:hypothetical protein